MSNHSFEVCGFEVEVELTPGCRGYYSGPPEDCYPAEDPIIELIYATPIDKEEFEEYTGFSYAFAQIWRELFPEDFDQAVERGLENELESNFDRWHEARMDY